MAGTPVLQIVDTGTLWVRTRIDQKRSQALRLGQRAEIRLRRDPETALKGRVARMELIADSLTEERWVDVAFEAIPEGIALGSLADVTLYLEPAEDILWIPSAALHVRQGQVGVWLLDGGRATFRPVELGIRTLDGRAGIRSPVFRRIYHLRYSILHEEQGEGRPIEVNEAALI
jgi:HlyD family secretion protein